MLDAIACGIYPIYTKKCGRRTAAAIESTSREKPVALPAAATEMHCTWSTHQSTVKLNIDMYVCMVLAHEPCTERE